MDRRLQWHGFASHLFLEVGLLSSGSCGILVFGVFVALSQSHVYHLGPTPI